MSAYSGGMIFCAILFADGVHNSGFVSGVKASRKMALKQIRTLASVEYLAKPGENCNFLLKHSVGSLPSGSEVDVPLTYADYYYLEALLRYWNRL